MKKLIRFITILFKKRVGESDLLDLWLIPFFGKTINEVAKHYEHTTEGTTKFNLDHKVSKWQYNIWHVLMIQKLRRSSSHWFIEHRFPFISRYKMSTKRAKKRSWAIVLNLSPTIREYCK